MNDKPNWRDNTIAIIVTMLLVLLTVVLANIFRGYEVLESDYQIMKIENTLMEVKR